MQYSVDKNTISWRAARTAYVLAWVGAVGVFLFKLNQWSNFCIMDSCERVWKLGLIIGGLYTLGYLIILKFIKIMILYFGFNVKPRFWFRKNK